MIGEDKSLDPSKYFIVTFALFSNGEVRIAKNKLGDLYYLMAVPMFPIVFISIQHGDLQPKALGI